MSFNKTSKYIWVVPKRRVSTRRRDFEPHLRSEQWSSDGKASDNPPSSQGKGEKVAENQDQRAERENREKGKQAADGNELTDEDFSSLLAMLNFLPCLRM